MKTKFDIIVIGAGAGGLGVAIGMAKFGFDVLMIERRRENFGGECLNSGCVPSKALIHIADLVKKGREAEAYGVSTSGSVNLKKVMGYVHHRQDIIRHHESAEYLEREEGISIKIGEASFVNKNSVEVKGERFSAKKILVATGSKPRMIETRGMERVKILTNENLFEIEELPENLLVIGGGPIGMEMSQCFARFGSKVTVVEAKDRIMGKELPVVSSLVQERLEVDGVDFRLKHKLIEFDSPNTAILEDKKGKKSSVKCDAVLVGIGREIDYQGLGLEKAGVEMKEGKPVIDDYLRAKGNKSIVFAGDAAHNMLFSHAAELHTTILLTNFFTPWPFKKKLHFDHFSWCTFTDPEVCTFGISESDIKEHGISYDRIEHDFELDDRAVVSDYRYGKLILFLKKNRINPRNGKILGGTVVAPHGGEMAQELIMAIHQGLGAGAIFNKTYPYPVQSRVHKMALVEEFSGGISSGIKKLLRFLY